MQPRYYDPDLPDKCCICEGEGLFTIRKGMWLTSLHGMENTKGDPVCLDCERVWSNLANGEQDLYDMLSKYIDKRFEGSHDYYMTTGLPEEALHLHYEITNRYKRNKENAKAHMKKTFARLLLETMIDFNPLIRIRACVLG